MKWYDIVQIDMLCIGVVHCDDYITHLEREFRK